MNTVIKDWSIVDINDGNHLIGSFLWGIVKDIKEYEDKINIAGGNLKLLANVSNNKAVNPDLNSTRKFSATTPTYLALNAKKQKARYFRNGLL